MIVLLASTSIYLSALQASIAAPTEAFRGCLKTATQSATKEKVNPDGIEDYYRTTCGVQMESLKSAVVAFRVKNGMAKKAASADADMTVEDYMSGPADKYRYAAEMNKSAAPADAAPLTTPAPAPASQPK
jgi:hypothetical protein